MSEKHLEDALRTVPLSIRVDRDWRSDHPDYKKGCWESLVTLTMAGHSERFMYYQGSDLIDYPTKSEVIQGLFLDHSVIADWTNYENYQDSSDYAETQISLRDWKTIRRNTKNLRAVLNRHFDELYAEWQKPEED